MNSTTTRTPRWRAARGLADARRGGRVMSFLIQYITATATIERNVNVISILSTPEISGSLNR